MRSRHDLDEIVDAFLASGGTAIFVTEERIRLGPSIGAVVDLLRAWDRGRPLPTRSGKCFKQTAMLEQALLQEVELQSCSCNSFRFVVFWGADETHAAWAADYRRSEALRDVIGVIENHLLVLR